MGEIKILKHINGCHCQSLWGYNEQIKMQNYYLHFNSKKTVIFIVKKKLIQLNYKIKSFYII